MDILFIGIDLGGTHIRAGLVSGEHQVQARLQRPVPTDREPAAVLKDIVSMVRELESQAGQTVEAIGCGVPGIVDANTGIVYQSPHFPSWQGVAIRDALQTELGRELFIDNDANCHALAEWSCGAGAEVDSLIALTLGTGIGGGIIIDGKIHHGTSGFAGELGHMVINPEGPPCNCGGRGCLEMYASATGLSYLARHDIDAEDLSKQAEAGDAFARQLFVQMGSYLGIGIASLVNVLGIHTIIIGGGVSASWDFFQPALQQEFERRSYRKTVELTQIRRAALGDDAGVIGAAYGASRLLLKA